MKIVLAYSGGLDTSVILKWLQETYNAEVVAYAGEVGLENELDGLEEKAIKTGASKVYIEDLREEFITKGIYQVIKAGSVYEKKYLLGTSIARPFIAKKMVEIALKEKADALAHGATGKGNDQVRFESVFKMLAPELKIIAPWRTDWELNSREKLIEYAEKNNIPVPVTVDKPYSMDKNILHISYEGGVLEDPMNEPPKDMLRMGVSPENAPDTPEYIELEFEKGIPVKLNNEKLAPIDMMKKLNQLGGKHGIGIVDIVENRLVGMKSRGVYETPAGTILMEAHDILESLVLDAETMHYKNIISQEYANLVYNGRWFSPLKESLDAFIDKTQEQVTGYVKLKLYKGNIINAGRKSIYSLYNPKLATFEEDDMYNHKDAEGFINLYTLPLKMKGLVNKNVK